MRGLIAVIRLDRQHARHQGIKLLGNFGPAGAHRRRRLHQSGRHTLCQVRFSGKWNLAGETPVQRAAQSIDIRADIDGPRVAGLFGSHIVQRAQYGSGRCQAVGNRPGQPEVQQFCLAFGSNANIRWLDVAMDKPLLVCLDQCGGNLMNHVTSPGNGEGALVLDHLLEILAGNVFHDQVVQPRRVQINTRGFTGIHGGNNVRML